MIFITKSKKNPNFIQVRVFYLYKSLIKKELLLRNQPL